MQSQDEDFLKVFEKLNPNFQNRDYYKLDTQKNHIIELDFSDSSDSINIQEIPDTISNLSNLTTVKIHHQLFERETIPNSILSCKALTTIDIFPSQGMYSVVSRLINYALSSKQTPVDAAPFDYKDVKWMRYYNMILTAINEKILDDQGVNANAMSNSIMEVLKKILQEIQEINKQMDEHFAEVSDQLADNEIFTKLSLYIEDPDKLERFIEGIENHPNMSEDEKERWRKCLRELLKYWEIFQKTKFEKFVKYAKVSGRIIWKVWNIVGVII